MFQRVVDGIELHFHLAGINNQNFLMRDEQTGSFWQQITGSAIAGPLKGRHLTLVPADELTFSVWKVEQPTGSVLNDVPRYAAEYSPTDWDVKMATVPTVLSFAQAGLTARDLMFGIRAFGTSRAYRYKTVLQELLIQDQVGSEPILLIVGPDYRSVRVFRRRIPGTSNAVDFYRITGNREPLFLDSATGSGWNFRGCAISGPLSGKCLDPVNVIKDYWFDWRNYNPQTTVYGIKRQLH